jgi:hypothetical protein
MLMDRMGKPFEIHLHPVAKEIAVMDGQVEMKLDDYGKY